jgi:hypothetical protein
MHTTYFPNTNFNYPIALSSSYVVVSQQVSSPNFGNVSLLSETDFQHLQRPTITFSQISLRIIVVEEFSP